MKGGLGSYDGVPSPPVRSPRMFRTPVLSLLFVAVVACSTVLCQPAMTNTGLIRSSAYREGETQDALALLMVQETTTTGDLNGNGLLGDIIPHVFDPEQGFPVSLGIAAREGRVSPDGLVISLMISEFTDGVDLNGDGDLIDSVAHVLDRRTSDGILNLGIAVNAAPIIVGEQLLCVVDEDGQGRTDLNQDQDRLDHILHVYDVPTKTLTNLRVFVFELEPRFSLVSPGAPIPIMVREDGRDLNGDRDGNDQVLHLFDGALFNVRLAVDRVFSSPLFIIATVMEGRQGNQDLNGDGDTQDHLLYFIDKGDPAQAINLGVSYGFGDPPIFTEQAIYFPVAESMEEQDLNGDGDFLDLGVLHFDPSSGAIQNVGVSYDHLGIYGHDSGLLFAVKESDEGASDLNGDGDLVDAVFHTYEATSGMVRNTGLTGRLFSNVTDTGQVSDGLLLSVREFDVTSDLNRDGDIFDNVLHWLPSTKVSPVNLGLAGVVRCVTERGAILLVDEANQGMQDLNLDGDIDDDVAFGLNFATREVASLGLGMGSSFTCLGDGRLHVIPVSETRANDLNGDGDRNDVVFLTFDFLGCPRAGNVNAGAGAITDVLFVNGSAGSGRERVVEYSVLLPLEIRMKRPPSVSVSRVAPYAVYAWLEVPSRSTQRRLPFGMGVSCQVMPISFETTRPNIIWNNAGKDRVLGRSDLPSSPAPNTFVFVENVRRFATVFLQGLIFDPGSQASVQASITNGILMRPVQ